MTNNGIVLRSRSAPATSPAAAPATSGGASLSEAIQLANTLATAGQLIPAPYRRQPGACLAVLMWAQANDVDPFTAMLNIHLIDEKRDGNPKPFVSAEMRIALATQKGFEFKVTEATREVCTIEVWRGDEHRGTWTSRITDVLPERFNIVDGKPRIKKGKNGSYEAKPTAWDTNPAVMLLRDAQRNADRFYVQTAAALVESYAEVDDGPDDFMEVIHAGPEPAEAEVVDDTEEAASEPTQPAEAPPTVLAGIDELRYAIKASTHVPTLAHVRRRVAEVFDGDVNDWTLAAIASDNQALDFALRLIDGSEQ